MGDHGESAAAGPRSGLMWRSRTTWWPPTRRGRGISGSTCWVPNCTASTAGPAWCSASPAPGCCWSAGGGPTADKPTVVFAPPADPDLVSHAMTLRVADYRAACEVLRSRGATFLTPPHDWGTEIRCFLRDPDGHLVEISQSKVS
jgi:Glyoxalase/Bleomycin resistance protein/Dioxygenase superfamily